MLSEANIPSMLIWLFMIAVISYTLCIPFIYVCIVRPFDKLLEDRNLFLERGIILFSILLRATSYSQRILRKSKPNWYDDTLYGDFDFRDHATNRQIFLSQAFSFCGNLLLVLLLCIAVFKYI